MKEVLVHLPDNSYPIYISSHLLAESARLICENGHGPVVVITDTNVLPLYGLDFQVELQKKRVECKTTLLTIPAGEMSKSFHQCELLYTQLIENRIPRDATIIALGGGVIGDLAGFVAATYLRGINFIQIPTTLLAQVDSSVGGKVGINHLLGKNLIGAFYHPNAVYIDPKVLTTLDPRELMAGMAEVVKYALIKDQSFISLLQHHFSEIVSLFNPDIVEDIVARCCTIKAEIVQEDERENGVRALLNFGHTIGHALESAAGYTHFRHGEAVARGMAGALWLSTKSTGLSDTEFEQSLALVRALNPPCLPRDITLDAVYARLSQDKKRRSEGQIWVLLDRPGSAILKKDVPEKWVREAIEFACLDAF